MRAVRLLAAALAAAPAGASASGERPFYGYAGGAGGPGYPLSLPQTLRGTVSVPLPRTPETAADTLPELYRALAACWRTPSLLDRVARAEITVRLALRRDGSLIGPPRITYAAGVADRDRARFVRSTLDGVGRCLPARITPGLGRAIAGRPIALRLVFRRPPQAG